MTGTATKARTTRTSTPKAKAKATEPTPTPEVAKAKAKPEPKAKVPTEPSYRANANFTPALKAAKSLAKGNPGLVSALQLVTHLAWKTPTGSVGWAKGTTPQVITYADDIAVPVGTAIKDAISAAMSAAEKAAADEPQKVAVEVLFKVIKAHA